MKNQLILLLAIFTLAFSRVTTAQLVSITTAEESVIKSALKDELIRSKEQLSGPEMVPPFFIAYTLLWGHEFSCSAKFGKLYHERTLPDRSGTIRLMVGDYSLNDENFQDSRSSYSQASAFRQLNMLPQEADYWAIRRYFWQISDDVFRSANDHYKHKLEAIKRQNISLDANSPGDYAPSRPIVHTPSAYLPEINKEQVKMLISKISAEFSGDTLYVDSDVNFTAGNYMTYYMNTEGTDIQYPYVVFNLNISASIFDKHGNQINEQIGFNGLSMKDLPDEMDLYKACDLIKLRLASKRSADTIPEDYSGPVLYEGGSTADFFSQYFFEGNNVLIASRENLADEPDRQAVKENQGDDQKYHKKIFNRDLTVMDCPSLKEYSGTPLYGSYSIDAEGIQPPDTLLLVENGVLRNMLNDRVPTPNQKTPNGHSRFGGLSVSQQVTPSVLIVKSSAPKISDELKSLLLKEADERNLENAIIIRPCYIGKHFCGNEYYMVSLKDHSEKLLNVEVNPTPAYQRNGQERILGCTANLIARNGFNSYSAEFPVSFIVPDAVLVEQTDLNFSDNSGYGSNPRLVPYPLVKPE